MAFIHKFGTLVIWPCFFNCECLSLITHLRAHETLRYLVCRLLLENGKKLVLEQIVTTTATVADTVEEHFVTYYDQFMPSLKYIMANAVAKEHRLLRGKTIECISLIGLAVGQEKVGVPQLRSCDKCVLIT